MSRTSLFTRSDDDPDNPRTGAIMKIAISSLLASFCVTGCLAGDTPDGSNTDDTSTATGEDAAALPASYHQGTTGCYNWSWSDGIESVTLYYHNTCSSTASLQFQTNNGSVHVIRCLTEPGGAQSSAKFTGGFSTISAFKAGCPGS
jgi:hypothetical protein